MRLTITLIIGICAFLTSLGAGSGTETPDFKFLHYGIDSGLPSNCIRDIKQDKYGFMWFATDGGLVRFDGQRCSVFLPENTKDHLSPNIYVMTMCMMGDDLIVGIALNLYRFDREKEKLLPLPLKYPPHVKPLTGAEIKNIVCDADGTLWVSAEGRGIYRIMPDYTVKSCQEFPELNNYMSVLYCDSHNNVWGVSTSRAGGVYKFDRRLDRFVKFRLTVDGEEQNIPALSIFEDSNGDYWLGSWTRGIMRFNAQTGEITRSHREGSDEHIFHIHSIAQYSPSRLLVGSEQGLSLYDIGTGKNILYKQNEHDRMSLSNQFVYPVMKDTEGGVWVGTFYGGVNYVAPDTKHIRGFTHSQYRNSVSGNVISCLSEDAEGNIWIGSDDGGVCSYNHDTGEFRTYRLSPNGTSDNVHALFADGARIWVGSYSNGSGVLDPATGKWRHIPLEGSDNSYSCYAIHKDRYGTVWMAANDCLNRYDADRDMFVRQRDIGSWIVDISEDSAGRLWIATQGKGVFVYNTRSDSWMNYNAAPGSGNLPHGHVNQVAVFAGDEVYAATINGIGRFDSELNRFERLDIELPSKMVESVVKAGESLWIATSAGLARRRADGSGELYTTRDGLVSNEFSSGSALIASDGRMYLGTVNGLCSLLPLEVKSNQHVPPVYFTGLEVVNRHIDVGDPLLPESLNTIDKLVLTHDCHTFSVYFTALSYANPDCNNYVYCLEGFDKDWILAGKENRATYSNLPAGNYTLRVKASNNDGIWNEEGVALKIEVVPVWYASWWMKLVYVFIIIVILIAAIRFENRRRETRHKEELARVSSNKEKEVYRTKLSFFTIVAHEIRTPVSLIIGPLENVTAAAKALPPAVRADLDMINRNAKRLLSLVNQMLDFKKVEQSALPMEFQRVRLVPVIEAVVERFKPSVKHNGAMLEALYPDGDPEVDICTESFTKLVSNLLNNARKFTKDHIVLKCVMSPDGNSFIVSVEDNGIGIKKENLQKIFTPFYQIIDNINESRGGTGLGLSIVKSIAEAHHGSVEVESTHGKGSKFIVTLPVRQEKVVPGEIAVAADNDLHRPDIMAGLHEEAAESKPVMLVVDDNPEMLSYISASMSSKFSVLTAENGKEGLKILRGKDVALIVCDWMMPVMDGLTMLKNVRADKGLDHIPFVMLTAKTDTGSKVESMKEGADSYVEKPFSMAFLEARVCNLLDMRRMLREKYSKNPLEPMTSLASHPEEDEFLTNLNALIEENFANPDFNVAFIADRLGMSRSTLYAKIKSLADVTPNELIQIARLKKAAALLAENKYSINEISFMVGFGGSSYFSRCFYRQFGIKPAQFAEKASGSPVIADPGEEPDMAVK